MLLPDVVGVAVMFRDELKDYIYLFLVNMYCFPAQSENKETIKRQ